MFWLKKNQKKITWIQQAQQMNEKNTRADMFYWKKNST